MPQRPGPSPFPVIIIITDAAAKPPERSRFLRKVSKKKAMRAFCGTCDDDNEDDLIFSIYYRGEGEQNWRLLKDKVTQHFYSWDTTTMPTAPTI